MKKINIVMILSFLPMVLILSGICYQYCATKIDNLRYPAPGKLIDIGGYKIHSYCTGKGLPTVILDAGLGAGLSWWHLVQSQASQFTRVCSFDRAGYGWSDSGKEPRTSETIIYELHKLLHATPDTPPPYILVGHSFGGVNMRLYANTFPNEVYGVILVDACHEKQYQNHEKDSQSSAEQENIVQKCKSYFLDGKFAHYSGITRWRMSESMEPFFSDLLSDDLRKIIIAKASSVKSLKARDSEWLHIYESMEQVRKSVNMLENKPLIVISRGKSEGEDALWMEYQKELAALSRHGKHIIAEKSGHMINVEQPEIIVGAIHELIKMYHENNQR